MSDTNNLNNYLTKTNATGIICAAIGCSRPRAEKAMRELQDAGRITLTKVAFSHAILISREDIEVVIKYLRHELPESD